MSLTKSSFKSTTGQAVRYAQITRKERTEGSSDLYGRKTEEMAAKFISKILGEDYELLIAEPLSEADQLGVDIAAYKKSADGSLADFQCFQVKSSIRGAQSRSYGLVDVKQYPVKVRIQKVVPDRDEQKLVYVQ